MGTATFWWILGSSLLMSAIALVGGVTTILREATLEKLIKPLVALAAGSMLGGALFHMLPESVAVAPGEMAPFAWAAAGFVMFFALEQFLHWHHCHRAPEQHKAVVGYLVLFADGVHNFIGGLAVAGAFIADIRLGITTWIAAAAHEVPQELGDFGVLVHSGWNRRRALFYNLLSGLTFVAGGLLAWVAAHHIDIHFLIPLAAGNFLYIAAADLVPEINRHADWKQNLLHLAAFCTGLGALFLLGD